MFPVFEDSGRSKGYCGVLFTSPKATEKACELDGQELHGRWLSVQPGKMYLKQWAEREKTRLEETQAEPEVGEFGQKVKKRKRHGFKDDAIDVKRTE
jgi:RNA recognition motif-containing protein